MLVVIIELVASTPFTVLLRIFAAFESECAVEDATRFASDVVAVTPLSTEVRTTPVVLRLFELIAVVVLMTPLTLEVITFAADETVLLEITLLVAVTPLIVVVKVLPLND